MFSKKSKSKKDGNGTGKDLSSKNPAYKPVDDEGDDDILGDVELGSITIISTGVPDETSRALHERRTTRESILTPDGLPDVAGSSIFASRGRADSDAHSIYFDYFDENNGNDKYRDRMIITVNDENATATAPVAGGTKNQKDDLQTKADKIIPRYVKYVNIEVQNGTASLTPKDPGNTEHLKATLKAGKELAEACKGKVDFNFPNKD
jgi:hypothetical protein